MLVPQYYCVFSTFVDYVEKDTHATCAGEIAFAGYGTPEGTYLITAAAGVYEGETGSLLVEYKDKEKGIFEYKLNLIEEVVVEEDSMGGDTMRRR